MKPGIHPEYKLATVHCACGNTFQTRSTQDDIHLDVCSVCHPYFTGKQRLMDTAGRVERFRRKWAKTKEAGAEAQTDGSTATAESEPAAEESEAAAPEESEATAPEGSEAAAPEGSEAAAPEPDESESEAGASSEEEKES